MIGRGLVDSTTAVDNREPLTAAAAAEPQQQQQRDDAEEHVGSSSRNEEKEATADASAPLPPGTRMSGWGTGTTAGLGEQRAQRRAAADLTDDDDDDGIPVIPDLEEEDMTRQVAAPPTDYALHLSTQKELQEAAAASPDGNKSESSCLRPLDPHPEPGIDLSVLFEVLLTPEELEDPNEVWDHGLLLQQLAAEMAAEEGGPPQPLL
ncbi:hypothetical protein FOZ61_000268 [Perkinsus olseni]|uniref:Uncharacterized protein n=1 Tax=Perkinsus olseni TaxID=32597 RepID=A0A7J6M0M2_PEROL|nr:hypothetical protein FOZ61_000268 [Perkinsus olseni]